MTKILTLHRKGTERLLVLVVFLLLLSGCSLVGKSQLELEYEASQSCCHEPGGENFDEADALQSLLADYPSLVVSDTPEVRHFVKYFQSTRRPFMEQSLERRREHYDYMARVFRGFGLPEKLIDVALVESGFKAHARSHQGAVGVWQLMPRTARYLGLTVSLFEDQRKDVELSTFAAARYLAELYERYEDWYLALAAYNAGPTRLSRAMRQADSRDFFEIARKGALKKETIEFVPKVLAASLIAANPEKFGFGYTQ